MNPARPEIAPDLAALNARPLPGWYDDAKFGIFIHWGLFSIPAFAARLGSITDAFKQDYNRAVAMTPYTEWYANAIKVPGTPSAEFHRTHYGDAPYEAFKEPFLAGLGGWDPAAWAEAFRDAGAKYVVLVTKHHDGFCLWPSAIANPCQKAWYSERDIVGELARAVRGVGLKFGLYYSGGLDWTFNREPLRTLGDFVGSTPGGRYPAYADAQARELIARYEPSVLWNDISWPTDERRLFALFADYYNAVADGVVNDRWRAMTWQSRLLRLKFMRRRFDAGVRRHIARNPAAFDGIVPPPVPHSDFRTPEYAKLPNISAKKWESTRGMSHSFGFNRNDTDSDYAPFETLLGDFIDGVSKNGNLLLNVGPQADGRIPVSQMDRLKAFGAWLRANGEAVYGARSWTQAEAVTEGGLPVRFTQKAGAIYLVVLGTPVENEIRLRNVALEGKGRVLADRSPVTVGCEGEDTVLRFAAPLQGGFAPAIAIEPNRSA
ncbi:MAG: alpha-L-fucosidase [Rhizomicrobium sp.]